MENTGIHFMVNKGWTMLAFVPKIINSYQFVLFHITSYLDSCIMNSNKSLLLTVFFDLIQNPCHICTVCTTSHTHCCIVKYYNTLEYWHVTIWKIRSVAFTVMHLLCTCSHVRLRHAVNSTSTANTNPRRANCISSTCAQKKNLNPPDR